MTSAITIALLAVSCAPAAPAQRYTTYTYTVAVPTHLVGPNERLKLVWEPQLASPSSERFEIRLCVALFGPWESVEALKRAVQPNTRSCPPQGAIATSETAR